MPRYRRAKLPVVLTAVAVALISSFFGLSVLARPFEYESAVPPAKLTEPARPIVKHLAPPPAVKAIYMSSWVAGTSEIRDRVIRLITETEINAVVIDVKDYTGRISFPVKSPLLAAVGSAEKRIQNIEELLNYLHENNIYVIGRISVFQDAYLTKVRPDLAIKRASTGAVWKDRKGISWLDPANQEVWDYVIAIATEAHAVGFDELNFDYIRFPSDGDVADMSFPFYNPATRTKAEALRDFFRYLRDNTRSIPAPISADLFGMTTTNTDDLGIGQVLENTLPYFDYVAPMVYPSHYPPGWNNFKNPAANPYPVIKIALDGAVSRARAATTSPEKIRPWLQDFDLGATYTPEMVRAQITAAYDAGLTSWMMWDPSNHYTRGAYKLE